jgi:chromate transporter
LNQLKRTQTNKNSTLFQLAKLFLKLGFIGFGGPAVHIALMEKEVVKKRKWLTDQHFLDLVGATNIIPGPNSTEMAMHIGYEKAGWKGLIVAGLCFIVPAVIITGTFAWLYQKYGQLPNVQPYISGIKPAIIAVVVSLMVSLGKKAITNVTIAIIGICAATAVMAGANEIIVLFAGGFAGVIIWMLRRRDPSAKSIMPIILLQIHVLASSNIKLFLIFLKIGSLIYGSGYVLFSFLEGELVEKGLLTKQQLIDAIAVGQFTPGPVFSSATFIGWQLNGVGGALAATAGIFLPAFILVAILNPFIPRLRKFPIISAFLDAVNVTSVALILAVVISLAQTALTGWQNIVIATISFFVTFFFKNVNTAFIILGGALLGKILTYA